MADKKSLGLLGFVLGSVTAAVTVTAFVLVQAHIGGHLQFTDAPLTSQISVEVTAESFLPGRIADMEHPGRHSTLDTLPRCPAFFLILPPSEPA